jgi:feruloyl-CoA synthase
VRLIETSDARTSGCRHRRGQSALRRRFGHSVDIQAIRDHVLCKRKALAEQATGGSNRASRLAFLAGPLSVDSGELTVKGTVSQHGILQRHADLVDELYADHPPDHVLCGFPEGGLVG